MSFTLRKSRIKGNFNPYGLIIKSFGGVNDTFVHNNTLLFKFDLRLKLMNSAI